MLDPFFVVKHFFPNVTKSLSNLEKCQFSVLFILFFITFAIINLFCNLVTFIILSHMDKHSNYKLLNILLHSYNMTTTY